MELLLIPLMSDFVPWLGFLDWRAKAAMEKWRSSYSALMDQLLATRCREKAANNNNNNNNNMSGDADMPRDILDVLLSPEHNFSSGMIKTYISVSILVATD